MPRLKLTLPEHCCFTTELKVRVTDLNYGNHLANDAVLALIHTARVEWLQHLGFANEKDVGGAGIILADAAVVFRREAFLGEVLEIGLYCEPFGRIGGDLFYRISRRHDKMVIAEAKTWITFFDYTTKQLAPMPTAFAAALAISQQESLT